MLFIQDFRISVNATSMQQWFKSFMIILSNMITDEKMKISWRKIKLNMQQSKVQKEELENLFKDPDLKVKCRQMILLTIWTWQPSSKPKDKQTTKQAAPSSPTSCSTSMTKMTINSSKTSLRKATKSKPTKLSAHTMNPPFACMHCKKQKLRQPSQENKSC